MLIPVPGHMFHLHNEPRKLVQLWVYRHLYTVYKRLEPVPRRFRAEQAQIYDAISSHLIYILYVEVFEGSTRPQYSNPVIVEMVDRMASPTVHQSAHLCFPTAFSRYCAYFYTRTRQCVFEMQLHLFPLTCIHDILTGSRTNRNHVMSMLPHILTCCPCSEHTSAVA